MCSQMTNEANLELAVLPQFRQMVSVYVHKESHAGNVKIKMCFAPFLVFLREQR